MQLAAWLCLLLLDLGLNLPLTSAQQVYVPTTGTVDRPTCAANGGYGGAASSSLKSRTTRSGGPSFYFTPFSFTLTETVRTATSIAPPTETTRYAVPYDSVKHHFKHVSSTSWGNWSPATAIATAATSATVATASGITGTAGTAGTAGRANATTTYSQGDNANNEEDNTNEAYGDAAWSQLWAAANPINFTRGIYSTTVSPTPVPSSELVFPPPLVFGPSDCYNFPEGFMHGVAGSASQNEGAVADEGKSPSLLDMLPTIESHLGITVVPDYVANEGYYLYQQDIERLAAMGLKYFSFSIAWTRILPFALPGTPINLPGLQHYDDLINFVLAKGMVPVVTLTHFDTPLQFFGGSENYLQNYAATKNYFSITGLSFGYQNETFEDAFVHYAKIVMAHYADRVPVWFTFNEPQQGCTDGKAINAVIKAHARVYHYYKKELNGTGQVSFKSGAVPSVPLDPTNSSHVDAALTYNDLYIGTFLNPLALGQDYPEVYKKTIQDYVPLSRKDLQYTGGTLDFIAADLYETTIIYPLLSPTDFTTCVSSNLTNSSNSSNSTTNPLYRYPICLGSTTTTLTNWAYGYAPSLTFHNAPTYLRTQLSFLWNTYRLPILVSEFGQLIPPPPTGRLQDDLYNVPQSEYILGYLGEILKAIWLDGVDVLGAFVWTWADDWEFGSWGTGFGLQWVNRSDGGGGGGGEGEEGGNGSEGGEGGGSQERRYRRSFFDYVDYVNGRGGF